MIVFRLAHYDIDGALERVSEAFPTAEITTAQAVADACARAADAGCRYRAGTFLVWDDPSVQPPGLIEQGFDAVGRCSYGKHVR